ncbi:MAG: amino acid permease [Solirubrobacteraceae bacterium]|nr:amino acid permease [Patulibacter sp.]
MATVSGSVPPAKHGIFATKPTAELIAQGESGDRKLKKSLGTFDLTAVGIGTIIGTGIYVIIGEAIGKSGPAIIISFILAAVTCAFSALSYAELASSIPISGSSYTYAYATLGELVAWIIGWDLVLEYGFASAAVSVGWGGYLQDLLHSLFSIQLPDAIAKAPGDGGVVNLPSVLLVLFVVWLLTRGASKSAKTNVGFVLFKMAILLFFVVAGIFSFHPSHFHDFAPHGVSGTWSAAALIFFAYIGFDTVSTASEEAKDPGKMLPRAIIGSLAVCTFIYILVAVVAIGLSTPSALGNSDAPLVDALRDGGGLGPWAGDILSVGALVAITSVVLSLMYGQTRILFAMARDGLLPRSWSTLNANDAPGWITVGLGLVVATFAALIPLKDLAELVNIGTLFAFVIVNLGVIVLRRTQPDLERAFRCPLVPIVPLIGTALCIYLMTQLKSITWERFFIWLALGLVVYFLYSKRHSAVQRGERVKTDAPA